jgi:nitrite reductase/ring-hydroxylating ferredoxin subunit
MKNKRRDFLKNACGPVLITVIGIPLIEACSKNDDSSEIISNESSSSQSATVKIDMNDSKFISIKSIGGWLNYIKEKLLLIRINENEVRVFDNSCPHQGYREGWSFSNDSFTCSNHGNSYANSCDGGLKCYESSLSGSILTVNR